MKKFVFKTGLYLILLSLFIFFVFKQADGYLDPFYLRFTSERQSSLILGTSRAAQGIIPSVLNENLGRDDIYNFSFTNIHSPYGATYFNSILKKLDSHSEAGIFIVAVDPWSISSNNNDPNNESKFRENTRFLAHMEYVNLNPNIPYLLNHYNDQFINIFDKKYYTNLHNDGWLEVNIKIDSISNEKNIENKILDYKEKLNFFNFSEVRKKYLLKTIEMLKQHGEVYLVRLPIHPDMMTMDSTLIPDFEHKIQDVIGESDGYFDMTPFNSDFIYTDGNHLYKESGKLVSEKIAKWIKIQQAIKNN